MRIKPFAVLLSGLLLSACAGTTPPPRFSALDPADPKAPESAVEARAPLLERPAEQTTAPARAASEPRSMGHEHHLEPSSAEAPSTVDVYSCPMHPQVRQATSGKCPICGTTLVKQAGKPHEEHRP